MAQSVSELTSYVADLEYRLQQYHEWLEQSIADRDRLALDAAWGVHAAFCSIAAYVVVLAAIVLGLGRERWWAWALAVISAQIASGVAHNWSNRHRLEEVKELAKLPEWEWKDPTWR
jgi:hypothetical protein